MLALAPRCVSVMYVLGSAADTGHPYCPNMLLSMDKNDLSGLVPAHSTEAQRTLGGVCHWPLECICLKIVLKAGLLSTQVQCVMQFLRLPIEDDLAEISPQQPIGISMNSSGPVLGPSEQPIPFADTGNPIMAQVTYTATGNQVLPNPLLPQGGM